MTITLHWWMAPIALLAVGVLVAIKHERNLLVPLFFAPFVVAAVFLTIGHFL